MKFKQYDRFGVCFVILVSSQEKDELPEDCIPDLPENKDAREFLAHAPSKGLWMPLGKEVKVMKCEFNNCLIFKGLKFVSGLKFVC